MQCRRSVNHATGLTCQPCTGSVPTVRLTIAEADGRSEVARCARYSCDVGCSSAAAVCREPLLARYRILGAAAASIPAVSISAPDNDHLLRPRNLSTILRHHVGKFIECRRWRRVVEVG